MTPTRNITIDTIDYNVLIDDAVSRWGLDGEIFTQKLRDDIIEAALKQVQTFFEYQGWRFGEFGIDVPADVKDPQQKYEKRIDVAIFYATKAIFIREREQGRI